MSLDANFELKIDGGLVMEIRTHPSTPPDAVADMLADATASFRTGFQSMMICGDNLAADNPDPDSQGEAHEPLPVEWKYFNYNPTTTEVESTPPQYSDDYTELSADGATATDSGNGDNKQKRDFYGEQPLIGKIPYTINGIPAVTINYHPAMGIGEITDILENAVTDLRKELESRNPLIYDPDTVTLTVPAMHVGSHITNLMDAYTSKLSITLEQEDYEAADKYFSKSEKLYEWMCRNYTPQAIKNSPEPHEQLRRLENFRGIREHGGTDTTSNSSN